MDEIGKLLPTLLKREIRRPEPRLLEILVPLWPRIAGRAMAQHARPADFNFGTLTLHTDCPTWAMQLRQMSVEICAKVNGLLGQPLVKKLRVKVVASLEAMHKSTKDRAARLPEVFAAETNLNQHCITDPEIASALAASYAKYFHRSRS